MRIAQLVGRLASTHCPAQATAPYCMARAVHSPLLVKPSSGLHCRYKKVLTVSRPISYVFLISIWNVLLTMLVTLHFPVDPRHYHRAPQRHFLILVTLVLIVARLTTIQ